jgi:hypothetical protein
MYDCMQEDGVANPSQGVPLTSNNSDTGYLCAWVTGRIARNLQLSDAVGKTRHGPRQD